MLGKESTKPQLSLPKGGGAIRGIGGADDLHAGRVLGDGVKDQMQLVPPSADCPCHSSTPAVARFLNFQSNEISRQVSRFPLRLRQISAHQQGLGASHFKKASSTHPVSSLRRPSRLDSCQFVKRFCVFSTGGKTGHIGFTLLIFDRESHHATS